MYIKEALGAHVSKILAPLAYFGSNVRHARLFHPEGSCYMANVEAIQSAESDLRMLGEKLAGRALVRFSTATWRGQKEWPDVLGCAIRFGWQPDIPFDQNGTDIQDILLATFKASWSLPFSPLTTQVHDFMKNHYYSVTHFLVEAIGKVEFRISPKNASSNKIQPRQEKLDSLIESGSAVLNLEVKKTGIRHNWHSVVRIILLEHVQLDQEMLRFSPFHQGKGIKPAGFINGVRFATYRASQKARQRATFSQPDKI